MKKILFILFIGVLAFFLWKGNSEAKKEVKTEIVQEYEVKKAPNLDLNGDIIDSIGIHLDVSDSKRNIELIQEQKNELDIIINNAPANDTELNSADTYYNKGLSKYDLEDYYGAIADFDKAIEVNPNYVKAYINRGVLKDILKDYKGAIADFTKAIELHPNSTEAYNNRGVLKDVLKDYKGAIADYNKAIEIDPNDASAYYNRGILKGNLKDYKGAIADYTKAIEIKPNYSVAYLNRGILKYYYLGDKTGGCKDARKAQELGYDASELINIVCN